MRLPTWILALAVFFCPAASIVQAQLSLQHAPPKSRASGFLLISHDSTVNMSNNALLVNLVGDRGLIKRAVQEISPEAAKSEEKVAAVEIKEMMFEQGATTLDIVVNSFDERVPAAKLIERIPDLLTSDLTQLDASQRNAAKRLDLLRDQLARLGAVLAKKKEACETLALIHKVPHSAQAAAEQRARLDAQLELILVEQEGLEARRHALETQIAEAGKKAEENADGDPVVAELEKAVALRAEIVERMRNSKSTSIEILAAESQLAEHKAELAKIRRDVSQAAGGQRLVELSRRLEDTIVQQAEATAKSKALARMRESIGSSTQVELKRLEVERLEDSYRQLGVELGKAEHKAMLHQPFSVTLTLVLAR